MLIAQTQLHIILLFNTVSDDQDEPPREKLERVAIEQRANFDDTAALLGELAREAFIWRLPEFQTATREFPLGTFIFQQHHGSMLQKYAFDRNLEFHCNKIPQFVAAGHRRASLFGLKRSFDFGTGTMAVVNSGHLTTTAVSDNLS